MDKCHRMKKKLRKRVRETNECIRIKFNSVGLRCTSWMKLILVPNVEHRSTLHEIPQSKFID
jgi:hypothetical protein